MFNSLGKAARFLTLCLITFAFFQPFAYAADENSVAAAAPSAEAEIATEIPFKKSHKSDDNTLSTVLWPLLLVLALGIGTALIMRHTLSAKGMVAVGSGNIKVLESKRLSVKMTLFLVSVESQKILIVQNGDNVRILSVGQDSVDGLDEVH